MKKYHPFSERIVDILTKKVNNLKVMKKIKGGADRFAKDIEKTKAFFKNHGSKVLIVSILIMILAGQIACATVLHVGTS